MKTLNALNAIILEIKRNERSYCFFLDSGAGRSFSSSTNVTAINEEDIEFDSPFNLNFSPPYIDLNDLSKVLGISLSGIIGLDFFLRFENVKIDVSGRNIEFNVERFDADFETDFLSKKPLMINLAAETLKENDICLVDTGAFQCMNFGLFKREYPKSAGWIFPWAQGDMIIDYYSDIPLLIDGDSAGNYVFGKPRNLHFTRFKYVLGLNFMAEHVCLFDFRNKKLKFKKTNAPPILNTRASYSLKMQVVKEGKRMIVNNKLEGCELNDINVGDAIELPNLDLEKPESMNEVYNRMILMDSDSEVTVIHNGREAVFRPSRLFV